MSGREYLDGVDGVRSGCGVPPRWYDRSGPGRHLTACRVCGWPADAELGGDHGGQCSPADRLADHRSKPRAAAKRRRRGEAV
jgi:hypothetical protein